ncbi:hypothetical protein TNCV_2764461 [Trichonephila clavipes]|nr:hypothetical protein TNCV_2764461 [Trichonephila clavipes]
MEIRSGSSDSNSSRSESSSFESVQRRVNESQYVQASITSDQEIEEEWSPDQPWRFRHNQEDQFEPRKAKEGTTTSKSKSKQDQVTRILDEEVINNKKRPGKERRS